MPILISAILFFSASFCFAFQFGERIIASGPNAGQKLRNVVESYRVPGSGTQPTRIAQDAIDDTFRFLERYYKTERLFWETTVGREAGTNFEYISTSGTGMAGTETTGTSKRGPAFWNVDYVIILDFSQPSSKKRLHLINIVTGEIESVQAGHGIGSDCGGGMACKFDGFAYEKSTKSPLGFFVTGQTINARKHGPTIILTGLEGPSPGFAGNDTPTTIVIHSAWYMNNGKVGRSNGCVALSDDNMARLRDRMDDGVLFYFYHPSLGSDRQPVVSSLESPASAPAAASADDDSDE